MAVFAGFIAFFAAVGAQWVAAMATDKRELYARLYQQRGVRREIRGYLETALKHAADLVDNQSGDAQAAAAWAFSELAERVKKSDVATSLDDQQMIELYRTKTAVSLSLKSLGDAKFGDYEDREKANTIVIGLNSAIAIANTMYQLDKTESWISDDIKNSTLLRQELWKVKYRGRMGKEG